MAEPGTKFAFENIEAEPFSREELKKIIKNTENKIGDYEGAGREEFQQQKIAELIESLLGEKEKFSRIFKTEKGSIYFVLDSGESLRIKNEAEREKPASYAIQPFTRKIFFVPKNEFERISKIMADHWEMYGRLVGAPDTAADRDSFARRKKFYEETAGKPIGDDEFRSIDINRNGIARLIGEPIATADLQEGVVPIEFDFAEESQNRRTIYGLEKRNLILSGREVLMADGEMVKDPDAVGVYHYGHPVSEVIFNK